MDQNAFAGHPKKPTDGTLAAVLGQSHDLWQRLVADLKRELKLDTAEWHSPSIKMGWSLRLQLKERRIVYLSPRTGYFLAAFALRDKAVTEARKSKLPAHVLKIIDGAKRYAEGTAVRIEVRRDEDIKAVKTLAQIKINT